MRAAMVLSVFLLSAAIVSAQSAISPLVLAEAQGACAPFGVASARYDKDGRVVAICNEDATAFVPLLGGLAPVIGLGVAAAVAQAISDGNATPDTQ